MASKAAMELAEIFVPKNRHTFYFFQRSNKQFEDMRRDEIVACIAALIDDAVGPLVEVAKNHQRVQRWYAKQFRGDLGSPEATEQLLAEWQKGDGASRSDEHTGHVKPPRPWPRP